MLNRYYTAVWISTYMLFCLSNCYIVSEAEKHNLATQITDQWQAQQTLFVTVLICN